MMVNLGGIHDQSPARARGAPSTIDDDNVGAVDADNAEVVEDPRAPLHVEGPSWR